MRKSKATMRKASIGEAAPLTWGCVLQWPPMAGREVDVDHLNILLVAEGCPKHPRIMLDCAMLHLHTFIVAVPVAEKFRTAIWLITIPCHMNLALCGAWGPIGRICHDARGWMLPTNGWTPMHKLPPHKNQHVARFASANHMWTILLQIFIELLCEMVVPFLTCGLLQFQLVTAWPYVECPMGQGNDALHAPKIVWITVARGFGATTGLGWI